MRDNWKLWLAVGVVVLVLGLAARRWHASFTEHAPAWLRLVQKTGAAPPKAVLEQFNAFCKEIEYDAQQYQLPIDSLLFVEVIAGSKDTRQWRLRQLTNTGMIPLRDIEIGWVAEDRLVGYYTWTGAPLHFTIKHHPAHPQDAHVTLELDKPVAPGASVSVLCVERIPFAGRTNAVGATWFWLGRLAKTGNAIRAVGVCLPENADLVQYTPDYGVFVPTRGRLMVGWLSSRLQTNSPPLSVTFRLH